jgi:hypothetical protein
VRRFVLALLVLSALALDCRGVRAAELVMFEEPGCAWCRRWHAEIGRGYALSDEGRLAPLRRVHIRDQTNVDILLERPITATPTFVLVEGNREYGRIMGYPGADFFYGLLEALLERLPRPKEAKPLRIDQAR